MKAANTDKILGTMWNIFMDLYVLNKLPVHMDLLSHMDELVLSLSD